MHTILTIVQYKKRFALFGFFSMLFFRIPLLFNKQLRFYKLMGTGKNGTFDKIPDLTQWAILLVTENKSADFYQLAGNFITKWIKLFAKQQTNFYLTPIEGHGLWDGQQVFGKLPPKGDYEGKIAVLTRATIKLSKLKYFWQNVAPVASQMATAKGFITSYGVGEIPWVKQATFSVWESKAAMKEFAYNMPQHKEVIVKTRKQQWYSEDMFTRFTVDKETISKF
jgi:heme-degrading monooxygenase HmoA